MVGPILHDYRQDFKPGPFLLTPHLLAAAHVLLFHGEPVDCLVGEFGDGAWLLGAAQDGSAEEVVIRQWWNGWDLERTVPIGEIELTAASWRRLQDVVRAQGRQGGAA